MKKKQTAKVTKKPNGLASQNAYSFSFSLSSRPEDKAVFMEPLKALTAAALVLPGLILPTAHAADEDSVDFQYSHYQEGKRDISGMVFDANSQTFNKSQLPTNLNPIEVDSLHGSSRVTLTDRIKFAFNYTQDTWSGATPIATAPVLVGGNRPQYNSNNTVVTGASPLVSDQQQIIYFDKNLIPLQQMTDPTTGAVSYRQDTQLTHIVSSASPETRKQGDFKLGYEWNEAAVDAGGGISIENDYESRFVNLGGRMDFNQKQTTVNMGLSYTNSSTHATLDPDSLQFIDTSGYDHQIDSSFNSKGVRTAALLRGNRQDWATNLGLIQILDKNALIKLGMGYTRSAGFMANPYKVVEVFGIQATLDQIQSGPVQAIASAPIEKRPNERNQTNWSAGYVQYVEPLNAALHVDYHFAHDDWGINAHTFEADWVQPIGANWTITPRIRYYSQSAADFYHPYLTTVLVLDPITGQPVASNLNRSLPNNYSSDQRLSGFGAISGGVTISKQFAKGINLETGFEYYSHAGSLKMGSGGEADFANYNSWVANAALKVNLSALGTGKKASGHSDHAPHKHGGEVPAGILFSHTLKQAGDMMVGYRFMRSEQSGNMLHGTQPVNLNTIALNACGNQECSVSPNQMNMNMHMLDLMIAPFDGLTLMLMPQWMDMDMTMTPLTEINAGSHHNHGGSTHAHQTGGVGDTGLYALFKLFDQPGHHINLSLGGTAPTGDVGITLRTTNTTPAGTLIHYGMQLGSGTWDFKPSLTYTGERNQFSWGAQMTGAKRLESRNKSGFAFGDIFQNSVWGGYQWTHWLSTTMRGLYTWQDAIRGEYPPLTDPSGNLVNSAHIGPFDKPANYGGQFVDLGLGLNVNIPGGAFAGNTIKFEWLQPLFTDYNGYQLDRSGALAVNWNYAL